MSEDTPTKKRKSNHVALNFENPIWIIMRQTKHTTVVEYADNEETARSVGEAMSSASKATVAVFGPQSYLYRPPELPVAVETAFVMPPEAEETT